MTPRPTPLHDRAANPHGEIRQRPYFSKTTGAWRRVFIYTPPDYDSNRETRYPVLFLQHGGGEDERGWVVQGRVNNIMDHLIDAKKAKPMIVVMERGYARKSGEPQVPCNRQPQEVVRNRQIFDACLAHWKRSSSTT